SIKEIEAMKSKRFILITHGDIVLMTSKEKISAPEIIDEEGRRFKIRNYNGMTEILNSNQIGLFNKTKECISKGIRYFYIDSHKDAGKFVRIYRKILNNKKFDDSRIKKGYTTGHLERGIE
ncbi:MAG: hypothetical protein KKE20_01255, partial [Nanoarchaeota archaeon]|nr:hypothetical protein [Nanoarchaeota archaeon]